MITKVRIQNFKSIRDVTVEPGDVTVLVGRSGSGKTNFVQAIQFLRDALRHPGILEKMWHRIRPEPKTDEPTKFEIEFHITGMQQTFRYDLAFLNANPRPYEETFILGDDIIFSQEHPHNRSNWTNPPPVVEPPDAGLPALGRLPSLRSAVIAYSALTESIGCYAFPSRIMLETDKTTSTTGLGDTGNNYLAVMKQLAGNLQNLSTRDKIVAALQRVNPGVASVELNDLHNPSHAVVGLKFNDLTLGLTLDQESEGFRRFYAHLLALYQEPPKLFMMFEHPEDGIHPGALSLLAEEFKASPADDRSQILLTTHSPRLLDGFSADNIRVVEREGFYTNMGPLAEHQAEALREELMDPGELLTVDPAQITGT